MKFRLFFLSFLAFFVFSCATVSETDSEDVSLKGMSFESPFIPIDDSPCVAMHKIVFEDDVHFSVFMFIKFDESLEPDEEDRELLVSMMASNGLKIDDYICCVRGTYLIENAKSSKPLVKMFYKEEYDPESDSFFECSDDYFSSFYGNFSYDMSKNLLKCSNKNVFVLKQDDDV